MRSEGAGVRIINRNVERDIEQGKGLCLNLGCGDQGRPGFYNLDLLPLPDVDIVADLNEPLSALPDDSVDEIYSHHTLEHVAQLLPLLGEIHRVARSNARIEFVVPHFSNPYGYSDPTHVRFFGAYTFFYFCHESDQPVRKVPNFYVSYRFRVESVAITLIRRSLPKPMHWLMQKLINRSYPWLDWYERRLCWLLPARSVYYVLRPLKENKPMINAA
jgi:SAM-dependent methyltransferase